MDDSVLSSDVAVVLGLIGNIAAPLAAFWAAGKLPRFRLWFHGLAFLAILVSPILAMILSVPEMLVDEEDIPVSRFAFLPLIVEAAIILFLYCLAGAMMLSKSVHSAISSWRGADRYL
ncbi:hypothetical protein HGP17_13490 [Rhizobium sp. P38BS-XIX]|uniref:hypothetical protein n=1 Tax=Rhizobium sp. P38BS-XIX TaxID=2726740 RepID=UPI001456FD76|nr:hypothetical protein [Rhizobium sp. P38BS-XIX]NLR97826.1 hypothetical protein [Rhizobium sp. P38BS-XIX]